jgi:hypothetical protein
MPVFIDSGLQQHPLPLPREERHQRPGRSENNAPGDLPERSRPIFDIAQKSYIKRGYYAPVMILDIPERKTKSLRRPIHIKNEVISGMP